MKNFTYCNPTKIIFGENTIDQIGQEIKQKAKKVLLTYGKSSIKDNGTYDKVINSLKKNGIEWVEYSGIQPNPLLSHASNGAKIAKEQDIDAILAVGGGSVIDESKAIAAGARYDGNIWDLITGEAQLKEALPLYTVLTIPATGSEMNMGLVLTNDETLDKFGWGNPKLYPITSILDPTLTLTVPKNQTAFTCVDIIAHSIEAYFTKEDNDTPFLDGYVENLVKSVMFSADRILEDDKDLSARANLMWTATMAWNGLNHCGTGRFFLNNHQMEHPISALYQLAHGEGLAILIPAWMKHFKKEKEAKLSQFFKAIFDDINVENGIHKLELWFDKLGAPTNFSQTNVKDPDIDKLTELALRCGEHRGTNLSESDIRSIYIQAK